MSDAFIGSNFEFWGDHHKYAAFILKRVGMVLEKVNSF
jgi:hypothetical protein